MEQWHESKERADFICDGSEKPVRGVLNEIARTGGPIIIERGGRAVAVILGVEAFERLRPKSARAKGRRALALEAFGMWANRADIEKAWAGRSRARWKSKWSY